MNFYVAYNFLCKINIICQWGYCILFCSTMGDLDIKDSNPNLPTKAVYYIDSIIVKGVLRTKLLHMKCFYVGDLHTIVVT